MINSVYYIKKNILSRSLCLGLVSTGLALFSGLALAATAVESSEDLHITVESGDTFTGIVTRELVDLDSWGEVARYNKLASPDLLKVGDVIIIPAEVLRLRDFAKVVYVKGNATLRKVADNTSEVVVKGTRIYAGDLIETDNEGFVSLAFVGGSSVNVQPATKLLINVIDCIDKEEACEINLNSETGQLTLDVQNVGFKKPTEFSIETPYASAAVRGTRFDFDISEGNTLGVTEGTVEISLNGVSNSIKIGKGVLAGEGRSINDTIDLLAKPSLRLKDELNRVSSEDIISWDGVAGAKKYLIAYAAGEAMTDVIASYEETDNTNMPTLALGDYYVSARAVDSNGLRGFSAKKKFTHAKIDSKVEGPELDLEISESEMRVKAEADSGSFEIKIGNVVEVVDGEDIIVGTTLHQIKAGQTITVPVDLAKKLYVQGREVVNPNTVSSYGSLYVFDKLGQ